MPPYQAKGEMRDPPPRSRSASPALRRILPRGVVESSALVVAGVPPSPSLRRQDVPLQVIHHHHYHHHLHKTRSRSRSRSNIQVDTGDETVSALPAGKMYRKSMQYHMQERRERQLRKLEELTRAQSVLEAAPDSSRTPHSALSGVSAGTRSPYIEDCSSTFAASTIDDQEDMILLAAALQKPPSKRTTRRLQEGLERSYPLYRIDSKKERKEAQFHLLQQKAQEYSRLRKSPFAPQPIASPRLRSALRTLSNNKKEPEASALLAPKSFFSLDLKNCIMPLVDEFLPIDSWPLLSQRSASPAAVSSAAEQSPMPTGSKKKLHTVTTREELFKLKLDLEKRKRLKRRSASKVPVTAEEMAAQDELFSSNKVVRFAEPLVTDVWVRPYTKAEDIEKLFFVEDELDTLEWDRANVEGDQFEVIAQEDCYKISDKNNKTIYKGNTDFSVSVTYSNKRILTDRANALSECGELIPFSPSDLSALYE